MSLILTATGLGYSSSSDRVSRRSTWWGPGRDVSGHERRGIEGPAVRCSTGHSARPTAADAHRPNPQPPLAPPLRIPGGCGNGQIGGSYDHQGCEVAIVGSRTTAARETVSLWAWDAGGTDESDR